MNRPGVGLRRQRGAGLGLAGISGLLVGGGLLLGNQGVLAALLGGALTAALLAGGTAGVRRRAAAGLAGERAAARALRWVPGARTYHDLNLGGENADHALLTRQGLIVVETKNYARCVLTRHGLSNAGVPRPGVAEQARRVARKLERATGVPATPIIALRAGLLRVADLDGVPVTLIGGLPRAVAQARRGRPTLEVARLQQAQAALEELARRRR